MRSKRSVTLNCNMAFFKDWCFNQMKFIEYLFMFQKTNYYNFSLCPKLIISHPANKAHPHHGHRWPM